MILIVTQPLDPHTDHVVEKLQERGAEVVRFHPQEFPAKAAISLWLSATGQTEYRLRVDEEVIDLNRVKAVWYRRPQPPIPHEEITDQLTYDAVMEECKPFVKDIWNSLDCLWVPAPVAVFKRAQFKASQLKVAGTLGFELPPTLFTNNPADFLDFYRQHNGQIVNKRVGFAFFSDAGSPFVRYTEVVSKRDAGYAHSVRYCPIIFQAYVPKRLELRITVVGQEVFAAEIHSQATNHSRHDWRRYDHNETRYLPHTLPSDVAQRCVQLLEKLGLCYGAIDMILTPDGRYVFLEINPNGQYLWIELATGLPISDAICNLLMTGMSMNQAPEHMQSHHLQEVYDERTTPPDVG